MFTTSLVFAAGDPMQLVGHLLPWANGDFGAVVVDADRGVAYMGSLSPVHGVAVIDMRDRAHPVLASELPPVNFGPNALSTSYDVDRVGRYLLVSHHNDLLNGFGGVSVWDISGDPFHPAHLRDIEVAPSCGLESAQLDPEVENGRPYAYCNAHCILDGGVYTVNILTGQILSRFQSPEGLHCPPFPCDENLPHESFVQRHPVSHKMLLYVGFWDSGLRILDVTDPANPTQVGAFDYGTGTPYQNAHGAVATPSGDWVYVGDELAQDSTGGVHVFDTHGCDGTNPSACTPTPVGFWHVSGHPVQDPNEIFGPTYLRFDVHNMTPRGENTLLLGDYGMGIRLVDTSIKADPEEISFYVPNESFSGDQQRPGFFKGPRTWVALFGSDGLVYASDINLGFMIVRLNSRTVLPEGAARFTSAGGTTPADFSFRSGATDAGGHSVTFTIQRDGPVSLAIFDAAGRRVALVAKPYASAGTHTLTWDGRSSAGRPVPTGLYFARVATPEGTRTGKLVHLAP
jgi:hypothetical protein